jgi:hypothetical protein
MDQGTLTSAMPLIATRKATSPEVRNGQITEVDLPIVVSCYGRPAGARMPLRDPGVRIDNGEARRLQG